MGDTAPGFNSTFWFEFANHSEQRITELEARVAKLEAEALALQASARRYSQALAHGEWVD